MKSASCGTKMQIRVCFTHEPVTTFKSHRGDLNQTVKPTSHTTIFQRIRPDPETFRPPTKIAMSPPPPPPPVTRKRIGVKPSTDGTQLTRNWSHFHQMSAEIVSVFKISKNYSNSFSGISKTSLTRVRSTRFL